MSYQRLLNFVKIVNDEFSGLNADLYPDRLRISLADGSWIDKREVFRFIGKEVTKSIELILHRITSNKDASKAYTL